MPMGIPPTGSHQGWSGETVTWFSQTKSKGSPTPGLNAKSYAIWLTAHDLKLHDFPVRANEAKMPPFVPMTADPSTNQHVRLSRGQLS